MGTRHLIAVVADGEFKIAQYGQWDGYPGGQGADVLKFLWENDLDAFRNKVAAVRFVNSEDQKAIEEKWNEIGADVSSGFVTMDQSAAFHKDPRFASMSRDVSAGVLSMVNEGTALVLRDDRNFALDSLFCEWAYVVDLDDMVFEIYEGFQKSGEPIVGRWADQDGETDGYSPVTRVAVWSLLDLPTLDEFLEEFRDEEEE